LKMFGVAAQPRNLDINFHILFNFGGSSARTWAREH
jgi:hypothetical protein